MGGENNGDTDFSWADPATLSPAVQGRSKRASHWQATPSRMQDNILNLLLNIYLMLLVCVCVCVG